MSGRVVKGPSRSSRESELVAQIAGRDPVVLVENANDARYLPTGHLVFARQGTLMAVALDVQALGVIGEPVRVIEDVMQAHLVLSKRCRQPLEDDGGRRFDGRRELPIGKSP